MNAQRTRVMLVDDHAVVRSGFRRLLEQYPTIEVVAEADNGEQAYRDSAECAPDVIVMDLSMPGTSGLETMRRLLARQPKTRIIVFSMHEDAAMAERAMRFGASGYVTKSNAPEVMANAVLAVAAGRLFLSPDIAHAIAIFRVAGEGDPFKLLTPREFEIFLQLVAGQPATEIAANLNLSVKTIANYHTVIKQKLRASSDMELVRIALRYKLLK
ncbi:MAG: response regulator transcription factor [Rudaea sp.]|nr:response regulator transcription factor [Rudaea sp.]